MPLRYPPSEIYNFVPLNERVPVYQKPFTLLMDVAGSDGRGTQRLRRQERARDQRHARVPGLRRQALLQPRVAAAVMDGGAAGSRPGAAAGAAVIKYKAQVTTLDLLSLRLVTICAPLSSR